MKRPRHNLLALAALAGMLSFGSSTGAVAQDRKDLVLRGDAQCTRCHDESDAFPVLAIGQTRHGVKADGRTPSCTSCHGESDRRAGSGRAGKGLPDVLVE